MFQKLFDSLFNKQFNFVIFIFNKNNILIHINKKNFKQIKLLMNFKDLLTSFSET